MIRWWFALAIAVAVMVPASARAAVERFAVVIGNNRGLAGEEPLRYATRDADKVFDVLTDIGGVDPSDAVLLTDRTPDEVRAALIAVNKNIRSRTAAGAEVVLFVYYSGHGSERSLHLGGERLALRQLEQLVQGSPATVRVLVIDACRSGAVTRRKGGRAVTPFDIVLDESLANEGTVLLSSTTGGEDAQESDQLQGSFFTHFFVSGLLGAADADGDDMVVLREIYDYAFDETLKASSQTAIGPQHPSFRYDLSGQGELALTHLRRPGRASLTLPRDWDFLVLADHRSGPVVAELAGRQKRRTLSLAPGTYFVRGRGPKALLEGAVVLEPGRERRVRSGELKRSDYAQLVRKGESRARVTSSIQAGYQFHTNMWGFANRPCNGAALGYLAELRFFNVLTRASWCRTTFGDVSTAKIDDVTALLRFSHTWDATRWLGLELGLGGGVGWIGQTNHRAVADQHAVSGNLHVTGALVWSLPHGIYIPLELGVNTLYFRARTGGGRKVHAALTAYLGLLLGKRF